MSRSVRETRKLSINALCLPAGICSHSLRCNSLSILILFISTIALEESSVLSTTSFNPSIIACDLPMPPSVTLSNFSSIPFHKRSASIRSNLTGAIFA